METARLGAWKQPEWCCTETARVMVWKQPIWRGNSVWWHGNSQRVAWKKPVVAWKQCMVAWKQPVVAWKQCVVAWQQPEWWRGNRVVAWKQSAWWHGNSQSGGMETASGGVETVHGGGMETARVVLRGHRQSVGVETECMVACMRGKTASVAYGTGTEAGFRSDRCYACSTRLHGGTSG